MLTWFKIIQSTIDDIVYYYLQHEPEERIREMWDSKPWETDASEAEEYYSILRQIEEMEFEKEDEVRDDFPSLYLNEKYHQYIEEGETLSSLDRNAAAAGFHPIDKYLLWRADS